MAAPIIPTLNDHELERMLESMPPTRAPARAGYVLLRLPHELKELFVEWLREHYPDRAEHVLSLMRQMHGGSLYDSSFHGRQRGAGPFAALLQARFEAREAELGLDRETVLNTAAFRRPPPPGGQLDLGPLATRRSESQYSSVSIFVGFFAGSFGFRGLLWTISAAGSARRGR